MSLSVPSRMPRPSSRRRTALRLVRAARRVACVSISLAPGLLVMMVAVVVLVAVAAVVVVLAVAVVAEAAVVASVIEVVVAVAVVVADLPAVAVLPSPAPRSPSTKCGI